MTPLFSHLAIYTDAHPLPHRFSLHGEIAHLALPEQRYAEKTDATLAALALMASMNRAAGLVRGRGV